MRIADDLSHRKNGRINGPSLGRHLGKRQYGSRAGTISGDRRRPAPSSHRARSGPHARTGDPVRAACGGGSQRRAIAPTWPRNHRPDSRRGVRRPAPLEPYLCPSQCGFGVTRDEIKSFVRVGRRSDPCSPRDLQARGLDPLLLSDRQRRGARRGRDLPIHDRESHCRAPARLWSSRFPTQMRGGAGERGPPTATDGRPNDPNQPKPRSVHEATYRGGRRGGSRPRLRCPASAGGEPAPQGSEPGCVHRQRPHADGHGELRRSRELRHPAAS